MGDYDDAAAKEEARLMKSMARRAPGASSAISKPSSSAASGGHAKTATPSGSAPAQSRAGAGIARASTHSSTTSAVGSTSSSATSTTAHGAHQNKSTTYNQSDIHLSTHSATNAGSQTGLQKSPSFGNTRSIVSPATQSTAPPPKLHTKTPAAVDEEAIRRREAAFDAERERLRQVELALIRNGKNALGDMNDIIDEAEKQEQARLDREMAHSMERRSSAQNLASKPPAPKPTPAPAPQTTDSSLHTSNNKALIDDVDALLAQLNTAASNVSSSSLSAPKTSGTKENPKYEAAKVILRTRRTSIPSFVANAMGATMPDDVDNELATYIRNIIDAMKPVQQLTSQVPLNDETFDFELFARSLDAMLLSIVSEIHLLIDHNSREMVSNYSMELVDKALSLMEDIFVQSQVTNPTASPSPEDVILSSQNKFILFLKHLAQSITTAAKKQVEEMQEARDKNAQLATCVQETALHAQEVAQILKEPLFEPQAFKDKLASLVTTIKKASPLIPPGPQHDAIMESTRRVLESSLRLQQHHQNTGSSTSASSQEPAPHIEVFHAVGDLLRAILATIQK